MSDWIPDRNPSPGAVRTSLYGFLAGCAILGGIVAGAVVHVATRAWPTGAPRGDVS